MSLYNWSIEASLASLARVAEAMPTLSHRAMNRVGGQRTLHLDPIPVAPETVTFHIPGRLWRSSRVIRALTHSQAEFVVFRRGEDTDDPAPLIAIARATGAFAVARQLAHSAWRQTVITRHPFRRLQEGEVSEVFAPFASLLVVRRDVFLQLGCPRAVTYGGALAILFWKASAAGLRSLTMGHNGIVTDEPAMALEDAELALRLTLSPRLAKLGPRHPHRLRGNIAWSPSRKRELRGKPRVLVVSPYLPFPLSHGGAVRIYNLCREMAGEVDFILACFRESGETVHYDELHRIFREVFIVDADEKLNDPSIPKQVGEYRNPAMSDLIRRLCLSHEVDLVQLEYTQLAEYRDDTGAVPVILVEHDITFTLYRQIAALKKDPGAPKEYRRWLAFEREALQCANAVWTMSEQDRGVAIEHGASRARTAVISNGVDLTRFQPLPKRSGEATVLFVGSFRHLPNLLAFEALRDSIMPEVWLDFPNAILHVIAGPAHERAAELAGKLHLLAHDPRIRIEGFVEDVRPAYRDADVAAIPLPLSAGTNIKLMEAMACGRAVVSTPAGCAGMDLLHGHDLLIAESWPEFAAAIGTLLASGSRRNAIAAEALRTAERRFG